MRLNALLKILFWSIVMLCQIQALGQDLVAYYPFDGDAVDVSGNLNNGELLGGVGPTADRWGNPCGALSFNGDDGYVNVPNSKSLQTPANKYSVTSWFLIDNANSDPYNWITLLCKGEDQSETWANPQYRVQVLQAHNQSTVSISTDFTEYDENYRQHQIPANTWVFFSLTYDGNMVRMYLNAREVWNFTYNQMFQANTAPLHIGRDNPGATEYFRGKLDDLRIFSSVLSSAQIQDLFKDDKGSSYNQPMTIHCPESYYGFTDPFTCGSVVRFSDPTLNLSCSEVEIKLLKGLESGSEFPVGVSNQAFLAQNESNQRQVCEFKITVVDNELPELTCPQDTIVYTKETTQKEIAFVYPWPNATDNCKVKEVVLVSGTNEDKFGLGVHEQRFRATDVSGNFSECSYLVKVQQKVGTLRMETKPPVVEDELSVQLPKADIIESTQDQSEMEVAVNHSISTSRKGQELDTEIDLQHELNFDECFITAVIFDGSKQDNDTVSLFFNDVIIMDQELVKTKKNGAAIRHLKLNSDSENLLVSYAWNTGQLGPNTLKIEFYRDSEFNKNGTVKIKPLASIKIHSTVGVSGAIKLNCRE